MKVEAVLRAKGHRVTTIQPWITIDLALDKLMGPPRIGALVVTGVPHGFTGILGERSVVTAMNKHGARLLQMRVSDVMVRDVPTCAPGDSIGEVHPLPRRRVPALCRYSTGQLDGYSGPDPETRAAIDHGNAAALLPGRRAVSIRR